MTDTNPKIAEFKCSGNIFALIFGDQIHDFMGERVLGENTMVTRSEKGMIELINKAWENFGLSIEQEKEQLDVESYQNLSEKIISKYSGKSKEKEKKELGDIDKFKNLNVNNKEYLMRYEEDLGLATRLYVQKVCQQRLDIDIQTNDYTADIHIDATKGRAHNFLTAMVNLPVTLRAVQGAGMCSTEGKEEEIALQNYFKQIKFTPLLANIFDMATFNQLYKTSAAYYNEAIKIKNDVVSFKINDSKRNTLEWELRSVPKFYNIAYWFIGKAQVKKFYNKKEVNEFAKSLNLERDNDDDKYFLYSLMIDGFKNFIDTRIQLSANKKTRTLKSVLKSAIGIKKVKTKEVYTFLSLKIKQGKIDKNTYKLASGLILNIIDDILMTDETKLKFYDIGCTEVYINDSYLRNIMFYSYITKLKLNDTDLTEYLLDAQKYLQGFSDPGASVNNIIKTIEVLNSEAEDYGKSILTLLMLKSLGDLTIITNSFYDGIVSNKNINFFASFDRTAACIATTLSYQDKPLYPYVLLEQPGYGVGAYEPGDLGDEFNVTDVVKLTGHEIIKNSQLEEYENSKSNCDLFKDKYLDSIEDEQIKQKLESLNCNISYNENWDILEKVTSEQNAGILNSLFQGLASFFGTSQT